MSVPSVDRSQILPVVSGGAVLDSSAGVGASVNAGVLYMPDAYGSNSLTLMANSRFSPAGVSLTGGPGYYRYLYSKALGMFSPVVGGQLTGGATDLAGTPHATVGANASIMVAGLTLTAGSDLNLATGKLLPYGGLTLTVDLASVVVIFGTLQALID